MVTVCQWFGLKTTGTVCKWFGLKTNQTVFSGLASKPVVMVFSGLASKPVAMVFSGLASKPAAAVSDGLTSKPAMTVSGGLASKPVVMVSWFRPQNQVSFRLSVAPQNRRRATVWDTRRDLAPCFAWQKVRLGFPSLTSRLAEAQRRVVHVAPSRRLCRVEAEDGRIDAMGCVGPCYHCFAVFFLLDPMGIVVI
jgi:hypothetical protein